MNDYKPDWVLDKVKQAVADLVYSGREEKSITVAMLGLSFKPNIDDLRESPALQIAKNFAAKTCTQLLLVEPNIEILPKSIADKNLVSVDDAISRADIVVLLVNHREFRGIKSKLSMATLVVDAVGIDTV